ncbi:ribosomal protein L4 [Cenarchaeum symbiosum A]|uniref:Large ribosomal subunit protein uL4 n=1 Tax=Cenarchaeum symbiosum (strain A) TaxID=414004 RepID=A0RVX5_CENSY|nr:ribosomal protein L4 [Cenarchaeum symbiosum A]
MKAAVLGLDGSKGKEITLPPVFGTPYRRDLIKKAYTILDTHHFQPKGTHPTAGMDVSADSLNPPTGHGQARIARMKGGGGRRRGEAGEVASIRGGRQAHPPKVQKVIHKKINKKEKKLALCSAIAATASKSTVAGRGHIIDGIELPIVISDDIESVSKASEVRKILSALGLFADVNRLEGRKPRTGKSALRGRPKKIGKSILFVVGADGPVIRAVGGFPGVTARPARDLSVLDLAPGAEPARLTVYSKAAIESLAGISSPHLGLAGKTDWT